MKSSAACGTPTASTATAPTSAAPPGMCSTTPGLPRCPASLPAITIWSGPFRRRKPSPASAAAPAAVLPPSSSLGIPAALMIPTGYCPISASPTETGLASAKAATRCTSQKPAIFPSPRYSPQPGTSPLLPIPVTTFGICPVPGIRRPFPCTMPETAASMATSR